MSDTPEQPEAAERPAPEPGLAPQIRVPEVIPLLGSGSTVVFPQQLTPVLATEERDVRAIDEAATSEAKLLGIFAQRTVDDDRYEGDLRELGTAATIVRMVKVADGSLHAILQGVARIRLLSLDQEAPWKRGRVEQLEGSVEQDLELEAMQRDAMSAFQRAVSLSETLPNELGAAVTNVTDPSALADFIAANLHITPDERQGVLEELNVNRRLGLVRDLLAHEVEVLEVQTKIQAEVRDEMDKRQREFILREQLKAIQKELGESEVSPELAELKKRLDEAQLPEVVRQEADREMGRLMAIPSISPEYQVARTYLEWLADLPWMTGSEDQLDMARAEQILNEDHYGLEKVKQRILDFLAVRKLKSGEAKGPILCFVGPPGTGKTSLGQSIARALGRKFIRLSLGGIRDEAEIRGHRRTYVGALPGRIIQEIRRCGANNPLFMLDEVDKLGMLRSVQGVLHHHRQPPGPNPRSPARPHGGHRAAGIHGAREAGDRQVLPVAAPDERERSAG
jgi:ATP-dependent Lon protease